MTSREWPTLPLRLYAGLADLVMPLAVRRVNRKLTAEGVAPDRLPERRGIATTARPVGPLIWFHGASVGETLSILPLVQRLIPDMAVLVTAGTAAAGQILKTRLPDGAIFQFAPLDGRGYVARFLDHWQPDLAVFVESEIWPHMLAACTARGVPQVLMNARLSGGSLRNWQRIPHTARHVFAGFQSIYAQTDQTRQAIESLGADPARLRIGGNMKAAAGAPPHDAGQLAALKAALGPRPVWIALSTHPGEEAAVLAAHALVRQAHPGALLVLVPRHPPRASDIVSLIAGAGFALGQRSRGDPLGGDVYLADTLGETGLWLRLAPVVFLGGSFVPVGGHNPWEPVAAGVATLTGPLRANVAQDMALLEQAGAVRTVADGPALGAAVADLQFDTVACAAMQAAARAAAAGQTSRTNTIAAELKEMVRR